MNALPDSRVLVVLNAGHAADEGIALAARLAACLQANVHALLVEDQSLLDAAALPFTSIVARRGVTPPEFSLSAVERALNQAEQDVRAAFSAQAHRLHLSWTMQRQRGDLATSLSACAVASDIVVLPADRSRARPPQLMGELRQVTTQVRGFVLPPRQHAARSRHSGPVVAIDVDDHAGAAVVSLASQLAAGMDCPLRVISLAGSALDNVDDLAARLRSIAPSLLVASLHAGEPASETALASLQDAARAPVLLLCSEHTHAATAGRN